MLKIEIIGNLGRDAKVESNAAGQFVAFNVCHSSSYTNHSTGEVVSVNVWVSCTLNGSGGNLLPFLKKGTKVFVRGILSSRLYKSREGVTQVGLNCAVQEIELCGGKDITADNIADAMKADEKLREEVVEKLGIAPF